MKKMEEQSYQRFVRRLLFFFKPSNKLFASLELSEKSRAIASTGLEFLRFLLDCANVSLYFRLLCFR